MNSNFFFISYVALSIIEVNNCNYDFLIIFFLDHKKNRKKYK